MALHASAYSFFFSFIFHLKSYSTRSTTVHIITVTTFLGSISQRVDTYRSDYESPK